MTELGRDLWKLGGGPQRILTALEWAGTSAELLVEYDVPGELIGHTGVDELAAPLDLGASVERALSTSNASDEPAPEVAPATAASLERATAPATRNTALPAALAVPQPSPPPHTPLVTAPRARVAEARAWLSAKAARAGADSVVDRPIRVVATDGHSLVPATFEQHGALVPAAAVAPRAPRSDAGGVSTLGSRLEAALARISTPRARVPPPARNLRGPSTPFASNAPRAPVFEALAASPLGRARAADDEPLNPMAPSPPPPTSSSRLAVAPSAPSASAASRLAADASALPFFPSAPAEPSLAEPPATPLRRFAMLAEAAAPPTPGQVASDLSLGPRRSEPAASVPAPVLDDVELAERLTRVLRREARRDGIELDPTP